MADQQRAKPARSPQARRPSFDVIEALLERMQSHLDFKSEHPLEDADRIINRIDEFRATYVRTRGASSSPPKELQPMIKDEPMRREKIAPAAGTRARSPELIELLATVVNNPDAWMTAPNVQFGGRPPDDLVGTQEESKIFDILHAVDLGLF